MSEQLCTPPVSDWSEEKYRIVTNYADMFTTSMTGQWHCIYVDLFAGAGQVKIGSSVVDAIPLRLLRLKKPFERYIFCELDETKMAALKSRVSGEFGADRDVKYVPGDANENVSEILKLIPQGSASHRVLTLCFADPYKLRDLKFETLRKLSERYIDFLVLIASDMDANRNEKSFTPESSHVVQDFLGDANWRSAWAAAKSRKQSFGDFIADRFIQQMCNLDYLQQELRETYRMRSTEKNLPLYRLALLSRHKLGSKFFKESKKYSTDQRSMF